MHLYGHLLRYLTPPWAGACFGMTYALMIIAVIALLPVAPADFDYGRY